MSGIVKESSLGSGRKPRESIDEGKHVFPEQYLKRRNFGPFIVIPWLQDVHILIILQD